MHIDHVGNVDAFPRAEVVIQEAERDAAYGPDAERLSYIPEAYARLDPSRIRTVAGDHDVFGDGTVVMTPLPGHTPGHQGLLVRLRGTGPVLLAGDIAYAAADYARGLAPAARTDAEQARRSVERAKRMERELGAAVWLHHDPDAQRPIRTAPGFYE